jgi:hypothetical protein
MRTSGTSASARNLIYADGILLSSLQQQYEHRLRARPGASGEAASPGP